MENQGVVYEDPSSLEAPPSLNSNHIPPKRPRPILKYSLIALASLVLIGTSIGGSYLVLRNKKTAVPAATPVTINTQNLDNGTLNKLSALAGPGESKQQLTISPTTLFNSDVAVQGKFKTAGDASVGGSLNVTGTTTMQGAVGINNNVAIRGGLNVAGALSAASINVGSLAITTVNVSGNLAFGGHIVPAGTAPASKTSAAAGGGTIAISGNDTAGTITITTGSGAGQTGELAIISFKKQFDTTPKIQLTPVNTSASVLDYYATRSPTFFTVNTSTATTPGTIYVFDYLATQ